MGTADERRQKLLPTEELIRRLDQELARAGELAGRRSTHPDLSRRVHSAQALATALKWQWGHPQLTNGTHSAAYVPSGPYGTAA
jgi:hypothetical protein